MSGEKSCNFTTFTPTQYYLFASEEIEQEKTARTGWNIYLTILAVISSIQSSFAENAYVTLTTAICLLALYGYTRYDLKKIEKRADAKVREALRQERLMS